MEQAQRNHIGLALRAYLRLEYHRSHTRLSIFNSKPDILRTAVGLYLAHPTYGLPSIASLLKFIFVNAGCVFISE
ncbi:MAG: hypothetical protein K8J31_20710, partial [Anaerolineae bacterium]|nr:hypothetical protein [Anaerolineae bacterium]